MCKVYLSKSFVSFEAGHKNLPCTFRQTGFKNLPRTSQQAGYKNLPCAFQEVGGELIEPWKFCANLQHSIKAVGDCLGT